MVVKEKMIGGIQMLGPSGGQQNSILIVGRNRDTLGRPLGHDFAIVSNLLSCIGLV
jgi:hypothetical protein